MKMFEVEHHSVWSATCLLTTFNCYLGAEWRMVALP